MRIEWDPKKAASNEIKHGVSFEEAKSVFEDPLFVDFYDPQHSINEHRYIIIGESRRGRILIVAYSESKETVRLISARETTSNERRGYEEG